MARALVLLLALSGCVFVDDATLKARLDPDGDGVAYPEDCDSNDASVFPGAEEVCDGIDQDCDGEIDEGLGATWYADADGDSYGDLAAPVVVCEGSTGVVENADDCDDGDADVHPGAAETDCEDPVDYNCDGSTGSDDGDGDGTIACEDCDDADGARHPGAAEVCDEVDQDCDGEVDEDATDAGAWFIDADADGFGDAGTSMTACDMPDGYVADATDCDDADQGAYPGAAETCDPGDDDCDGEIDEDATDALAWYADADGDGYGDAGASAAACEAPAGYVADDADCDDGDAAFHPGADEADCTDPSDYNCDGSVAYADVDGDGFAACEDCDDTRADVSPVGVEVCGGVDEDCDGVVDEADAFDAATWYFDADADGYGDATVTAAGCAAPSGYVADATDCDDTRGDVSPAGVEVCGDVDEDCDGTEDEAGAVGESTWHADADGDGYGDASATLAACDAPSGYLADATDCDDSRADVSPVGTEVCDAADADEDCDGLDEDDDPSLDASTRGSFYSDLDGDGYGAGGASRWCDQPARTSANGSDCDDGDGAVNPGASEDCATTVDDDCDGSEDEEGATGCSVWWLDSDGDGFGASWSVCTCAPSGDFSSEASTDCDDAEAGTNPGEVEVCDADDSDEDCNGYADDGDTSATGQSQWYADADGDGYGDPAISTSACDQPAGYVAGDDDCDDADAETNPRWSGWLGEDYPSDCTGASSRTAAEADLLILGTSSEGEFGYDIAATDLDGSGVPDLIVAKVEAGERRLVMFLDPGSSSSSSFSESAYSTRIRLSAGGGWPTNVEVVGDWDGDGIDDLVAGIERDNDYWYAFSGAELATSSLTTSSAIATIDIGAPEDLLNAGDVNGDGVPDLVAGANGSAGLYFGGTISLSGATVAHPSQDVSWESSSGSYGFGQHVGPLGDVNNDGYVDVFVGDVLYDSSTTAATQEVGCLAVVEGSATMADATADCPSLGNFSVVGQYASERFGWIARGLDVDGDGSGELVTSRSAGAIGFWGTTVAAGGSYVVTDSEFLLTAATYAGVTDNAPLMTACDIDADGVEDLVATDGWTDGSTYKGYVRVVLGDRVAGAGPTAREPASATFEGESSDDVLGAGVQCVDANADGMLDIWASAPGYGRSDDRGAVYLFLGR